jgi:hypothetical protein
VRKIQGTIIIDGLIEGRIPALPQAEEKLRAWVDSARAAGLKFVIQVDGDRFTLLADNKPMQATKLAPQPSEAISTALMEMLKTFPPAERGKVSSTIRSVEFRPGQEVQTLYPIASDGTVNVQTRTVESATHVPPPPMTIGERVKMGLFSLAGVIAVLALSALFVDYRGLWRDMKTEMKGPSAEAIEVQNETFGEYFVVEKKEVTGGGKSLRLLLRRTAKFPQSSADLAMASTQPQTRPVEHRLLIDSLASGYMRAEYFDGKGGFQSFTSARIAPLRQSETMELVLPLSSDDPPRKIVFTN